MTNKPPEASSKPPIKPYYVTSTIGKAEIEALERRELFQGIGIGKKPGWRKELSE